MTERRWRAGRHSQSRGFDEPHPARYEHPLDEGCVELRIPVPLDDPDAEIHIRMRHHDTRLVFFAIVLTLRDEKGEWRESCSVVGSRVRRHPYPLS